jgi:hypothetical protein
VTAAAFISVLALNACGGALSPATREAATTDAPETTVVKTTVPKATVPKTTVPRTTVPETTVPKTTIPRTTVPRTTPPTTVPAPAPKEGTRTNPFDLRADAPDGSDMLSSATYSTLVILNMRPVDPAAIHQANQFNDEAPAGKYYAALTFAATVDPAITEPVSGSELAYSCSIVGDKGRVYDNEFVSDMDGALVLITDQPDAIGGGSLTGDVLYLVDADDTNLLVLCNNDTYIIPG